MFHNLIQISTDRKLFTRKELIMSIAITVPQWERYVSVPVTGRAGK